jgi:hypothetical protein
VARQEAPAEPFFSCLVARQEPRPPAYRTASHSFLATTHLLTTHSFLPTTHLLTTHSFLPTTHHSLTHHSLFFGACLIARANHTLEMKNS